MLIWIALASLAACRRAPAPASTAIRLVDLYRPTSVQARVATPPPPRTEWRFDGAAPLPAPDKHIATRGWEAGPGVGNLRIRDGRLVGRATTAFPLLHVEWPGAVGNHDTIHAVEVRLRVSAGKTAGVDARGRETVDLAEVLAYAKDFPWDTTAPLPADGTTQTLTLRPPRPVSASDFRHLFLRPTDVVGAEFTIESVRIVTRREHLAGIPSGVGWQGLSQVYRETLVARAPEVLRFELAVPPRALLDLGVGTVEDAPVQFDVRVVPRRRDVSPPTTLLSRTVTTPHRWEPLAIDLASYAGERVTLELALAAEARGALGFWGSPVVRVRVPAAAAASAETTGRTEPPQGVILVWADTLRRDHLSAYGYRRPTSPNLALLARQGTRFDHCVSQATWTKVATPSLLASLYPTTHGVTDFTHRLPASFTTLAEVFRAGGFATVSMSSILFTGQFTNLHQGFEELHEDMSLPDRESSKTARIYVDRLLPWLERHREVPFFAFLHISDAHDPYRPAPPYDALWNDPAGREEHEKQNRDVRKRIAEPLLKAFGMPTRVELQAAGFDPERYVTYDRGWYDGSIRGMDAELGRLVERLRELGLERKTLIVFVGDHGEEFLEHGRTFHGQSTYGELANVPLLLWRPGVVPAGKVVGETVEIIDVMPTILDLAGLPVPREAQGRSLRALLGDARAKPWRNRPAFTEKNRTFEPVGAPPPLDTETFTVVDGDWKLVHNTVRPRGGPEFELYATRWDPYDQRDMAAEHPEVVARLAQELADWHAKALAARHPAEAATARLAPEELERLRALGYVQ
ncbi:MAG TPA: sulfatase [Thermoanaerobaculia bacterium]|nr:sulfatase [Thermoanaerobaculia bacterium]